MLWNVTVETGASGAVHQVEADTEEEALAKGEQLANDAAEHPGKFTATSATPVEED